MLRDIQINVGFGGSKREVKIILFPFHWTFGRSTGVDPHIRRRAFNLGPITVIFKRLMYVLSLLVITGSVASAQQYNPYYHGTPPNAVYRQPIQVPIYQPGVRIYYRSQHVPVPGFGTIITNEYRHAPSYRSSRRPNPGQSRPYSQGSGSYRRNKTYPNSR